MNPVSAESDADENRSNRRKRSRQEAEPIVVHEGGLKLLKYRAFLTKSNHSVCFGPYIRFEIPPDCPPPELELPHGERVPLRFERGVTLPKQGDSLVKLWVGGYPWPVYVTSNIHFESRWRGFECIFAYLQNELSKYERFSAHVCALKELVLKDYLLAFHIVPQTKQETEFLSMCVWGLEGGIAWLSGISKKFEFSNAKKFPFWSSQVLHAVHGKEAEAAMESNGYEPGSFILRFSVSQPTLAITWVCKDTGRVKHSVFPPRELTLAVDVLLYVAGDDSWTRCVLRNGKAVSKDAMLKRLRMECVDFDGREKAVRIAWNPVQYVKLRKRRSESEQEDADEKRSPLSECEQIASPTAPCAFYSFAGVLAPQGEEAEAEEEGEGGDLYCGLGLDGVDELLSEFVPPFHAMDEAQAGPYVAQPSPPPPVDAAVIEELCGLLAEVGLDADLAQRLASERITAKLLRFSSQRTLEDSFGLNRFQAEALINCAKARFAPPAVAGTHGQ